jgi:energy-coupling factor transporter ATP-binding protein EcfA2
MSTHSSKVISVFLCTSNQDQDLCQKLERHLFLLVERGWVTCWSNQQVLPGMPREQEIASHRQTTDLFLLLISSDFYTSQECREIMQDALQRTADGSAVTIPILLRPFDSEGAKFPPTLQVLPRNLRPVTGWTNRDKAFKEIASEIRRVVEALRRHVVIISSLSDQTWTSRLTHELTTHGISLWEETNTREPTSLKDRIREASVVVVLASPETKHVRTLKDTQRLSDMYQRPVVHVWILSIEQDDAMPVSKKSHGHEWIAVRPGQEESAFQNIRATLNRMRSHGAPFSIHPPQEEPEPRSEPRNPYKGLHAFMADDARDFFGREKLVQDLVNALRHTLVREQQGLPSPRFLTIIGPSGSGKSSVAMAGLLPHLQEGNISGSHVWIYPIPVIPGAYPLEALALAFAEYFPMRSTASLLEDLKADTGRGLHILARQIAPQAGRKVVLLIDQFEELFTQTISEEERRHFIELLVIAASEPHGPVVVILTLRADFYDRPMAYPELSQLIQEHMVQVSPLNVQELRAVIEKPAMLPDVQLTFESDLVGDLLYEMWRQTEALPLLQFTLEQLFHRRSGHSLTIQSYQEIGGIKGALTRHAENIYHQLHTPERQAEARKLFTEHLISLSEAYDEPLRLESGEGITRRRVTQAELQLNDPQSRPRRETIDAFVNARLLTATSTVRQSADQENIADITYEISHEVLINAWERLREWIKEDRKDIYLMQSHRQRIKQWVQEVNPKRKKEFLIEKLTLRELQEYRQRKQLDPLAEAFFRASLTQQRQRKIRRYLWLAGMAALVILSFVLEPILRNVFFPDPTLVTSIANSGSGTLSDALQRASNGTTITFDASLTGKTIYLTSGVLDINKSITLHGPAGGINISTGKTGNYISIEKNQTVTIENVTFINSYTQKYSIIMNKGNLTINHSKMIQNKSYGSGGAIFNTGNLTLNDDRIEDNEVSGNGGAIYNHFGVVSINHTTLSGNDTYGNGGGIYSRGGRITLGGGSSISNNRAEKKAGGGIDIVDGSLSMSDTHVDQNQSGDIGGGIALVGSVALITTSVITANTASTRGGGIAVIKDTGNNFSSLLKLRGMSLTDNSSARYFIGQNRSKDEKNIAGTLTTLGIELQISDDTSFDNSVEKISNFLGVADLYTFCLSQGYSYGDLSTEERNATEILFTCFKSRGESSGHDFSGRAICQFQYPDNAGGNTVIDRMASHSDPTNLECYKNLKLLGSIGQDGFAKYCASQSQYLGLFDNSKYRQTAYDWLCQPKDAKRLPTGVSVTDVCKLLYNRQDAIDRLVNFNSTYGWECWAPA